MDNLPASEDHWLLHPFKLEQPGLHRRLRRVLRRKEGADVRTLEHAGRKGMRARTPMWLNGRLTRARGSEQS